MSTAPTIAQAYAPIQPEIAAVRETMGDIWKDALSLVDLDPSLAPRQGGKMLRPGLCLLSAGALGADDLSRYVRLAAAFEALHVASLAHDDVIDHALLRRGASSLNAAWDNHAAVLGGDYLVARAVELLAEYDSCTVVANAIRSVRRMAEGELCFFGRTPENTSEQDCIALARGKTASLFAEACAAPAHLLAPDHCAALHGYGIALGIAFQLVDDLLDVTQPEEVIGKPSCGDVAEGKQTLPLRYLREALDRDGQARLDGLKDADLTDQDRAWVMTEVAASGAGARTQARIDQYTDEALGSLDRLPPGPFIEAIRTLTHSLATRTA